MLRGAAKKYRCMVIQRHSSTLCDGPLPITRDSFYL